MCMYVCILYICTMYRKLFDLRQLQFQVFIFVLCTMYIEWYAELSRIPREKIEYVKNVLTEFV